MVREIQLDFRFGWRWLIPMVHGDLVLVHGFEKKEVAFWQQTLPHVTVTENAKQATVLLVKDLPPSPGVSIDPEYLRTLCIIGSGNIVAAWQKWMGSQFGHVSVYSLLPPNNPRLIVPLGVKEWVVESLGLHRPGRWLARVANYLLKRLPWSVVKHLLRGKIVCIANKDASIPPLGVQQSVLDLSSFSESQNFSLFLGNPNDNRKTVVLPLGHRKGAILKWGETPKAKAALQSEAAALKAMSLTTLAYQVPVLFDMVEKDDCLTMYQEYRPRLYKCNRELKQEVVVFLAKLARENGSERPLGEILSQPRFISSNEAWSSGKVVHAQVRDFLDDLAESGIKVWGNLSHGDFAPWNCSWTAKGFFVFDWEESQSWDVGLGDAFYFILAPALHVAKNPNPVRTINKALNLAAKVVERAELGRVDLHLHFALWALSASVGNGLLNHIFRILESRKNL